MGCAITGEKKVIPSIIGGKKKKQDATSSDSNPLELPNPNGSVTELPIKRMSLTNDYIDPIITQIGPKPEQKDRGPQPPFILKVKSPVETSPKSKQISPIPRDDPNCRGTTAHLSEEMSFKRPVISTFHSMGRIASLTSVDLGDNSHAPKAHPIPISMNNGGMPSALLTVDKGESLRSLRSLPLLAGVEDRPSIEDIITKKDHGKCVSSLGLVEAVEEVSVSREININKHDEPIGYLKPNQSDNNIEGKVQRARSHGESGVYGNLCILIPTERVIKNVSRHILHKDGGPSGARTPEDVEEIKERKDVAEKIRSKNTLEPQIENSCFLKSPEGEKMKAQMKVKFTRNLVELVAKKGADNKENLEPNKTPLVRNEPVPTDRENSLSLVYCPPDEMESNKPNLDMKILDIFKGNEEISPIRRTNNRAFYEEMTPLASRENSAVKKKVVESSTLLEEKTITNIEENLSESDIDKYSFVAEVREVEIDEKNDFNIYKGQNAQILPHPLVQKSACGNRHLVFARSSTLDPKTLSSTPTDVDKCPNKEGKNENEQQLAIDLGLESDKIC